MDVHADGDGFIAADSLGRTVGFLEVDTLDFILREQAQRISGFVKDSIFYTGIESVYVSTEDPATSVYTAASGRYTIDGLEAGEHNISFTHPDFFPEYHTVTIEVSAVNYSLSDTLEQVIWHVETTGNDNTGDGRKWNPFATIQTGIDIARTDDTVLVGPGTYWGSDGNNDITLNGSPIVVISEAGPELTIIDCQADVGNQHRGFVLDNDPGSTISGFTITNAYHTDGAGIWIKSESFSIIDGCIITGNHAVQSGGGIAIERSASTVKNCVIRDNISESTGGGIYLYREGAIAAQVENCTITRNWAGDEGGGVYCESTDINPIISECIIWDNLDDVEGQSTDQIDALNSVPSVTYCAVQSDPVWEGEGNMNDHPLFCNPTLDDFNLAENSPCYDYPYDDEYIGALGMGCDTVGVIYGTVVDFDSGDSISGVEVVAVNFNDTATRDDTTDSYGHYELPFHIIPNEINTADVDFSHPAYGSITVEDVVFVAGYNTVLDISMVSGCEYIPGDCNNNGTRLELDDVISMINFVRGSEIPELECDCPPNGVFAVTADPNGNCIPFEFADIITEIGAYRGEEGVEVSGCPDCPGVTGLRYGDRGEPIFVPSLKSRAKRRGTD